MDPNISLDALRVYHTLGWPLVPYGSRTKAPLTQHGYKDATTDWPTIEAWHRQYPGCAWGTATSDTRGVIDIDPRNGGAETLARLTSEHGPLPQTPCVRTGGGGWHLWVRFPAGIKSGIAAPGIDRKAIGGAVILPPSRLAVAEHTGPYRWEVRPWEAALAEAPAWALGAGAKAGAKPGADASSPWVVRQDCPDLMTHPGGKRGERWHLLTQMLGVHIARGDSPSTIWRLAEAWVKRSEPEPSEPDWWRQHVAGLLAEAGADGLTGDNPPSPHTTRPKPKRVPADPSVWLGGEEEEAPRRLPDPSSSSPPACAEVRAETSGPTADPSSSPPPVFGGSEGEGGGGLSPDQPSGDKPGADQPQAEPSADPPPPVADWPTLGADAYHGLLGQMLRAVEPETEADPAGILLGWLTCFGNAVGRGAWVSVGPRRHYPTLFVAVCGKTSDAKGDAWAVSRWPFAAADQPWATGCVCSGIGSGEGLVERVCDEQRTIQVDRKTGKAEEVVIPGAADKRCLVRLSELSACFKRGRREGSTLSEMLREMWDGDPVSVPNRGRNALAASGYSVSVVGDITPGVIRKTLEQGTEAFDGSANRFLWVAVRSPRSLPDGGDIRVLEPFATALADALAFSKTVGEVRRDAEADRLWRDAYDGLKGSGDSIPHTDRGRPQVVRISLLYALADRSPVIRREHLAAALSVWDYCRHSARMLFGGSVGPKPAAEPDPLWLEVFNALPEDGYADRWRLNERLKRRASAEQVGETLAGLAANGMAHRQTASTGGRPAERWGRGPGAESQSVDNPSPPCGDTSANAGGGEEEVGAGADGLFANLGGEEEEGVGLTAEPLARVGGEEEEVAAEMPEPGASSSSPPPPSAECDAGGSGVGGRAVIDPKPDPQAEPTASPQTDPTLNPQAGRGCL